MSLLLLVCASSAFAGRVTLNWDSSTDSRLAGYKVYYGSTSGQYGVNVDAGLSTTATFSELKEAKVYYFAATVYDADGNESVFSNEVSYDLATVDTDQDGLSDWEEISLYKTNPDAADSDGDGLSDGDEVKLYKTDPLQVDTDGDGVADGAEVKQGSDPSDPTSTPTPSSAKFAVNAGGGQYLSSAGTLYQADAGFTGGTAYAKTTTVAGTVDPTLYQTERYGNFSYDVPMANGDYQVTLRFAEIFFSNVGQRVFDVAIEGVLVLDDLDLVAQVGPNVAYDVVIPMHVTDGVLNIKFSSVVNNAKVNAIEVSPAVTPGKAWADYVLSLKMWSKDDDAIGVMFRYQNGNNYYRFSWDKERGYRRLVKRQGGSFTLLAEDRVAYVPGRVYQMEIVADGPGLEVWIDAARIFSVTDTSLSDGSIALYTWYNWGSYFDDVVVTDLDTGAVLLSADFTDGSLTDWSIVDDGKSGGPSAWSVANGSLLQNADIYTKPTNRQDITKLGTYLLYKQTEPGM